MQQTLFLLAGLVAAAMAATSMAPPAAATTEDNCFDQPNVDCWSRPDEFCFGIYKPWSTKNCPLRCGFCDKPVPCEDKLAWCAQFEANTCTDPNYAVWARTNCRKHCNLCHTPVDPNANGTTAKPAAGGVATAANNGAGTTMEVSTPPHPADVTIPPGGLPGTVGTGSQTTIIVQGAAASTPGKCLYQGSEYDLAERWNVGCQYECSCLDAVRNRVVCEEKCIKWSLSAEIVGCRLVKEPEECCERLLCDTI